MPNAGLRDQDPGDLGGPPRRAGPAGLRRAVAQAVEAQLPAETRLLLQGDTDSERFFLAILSRLGDEGAQPDRVVAAFAESVTAITSTLSCSSLNSMLVTPTHLYVLCCFDAQAELKEEETEYCHLQWRSTPEAVVVASSGWGTGWVSLKNGQLLVIERSTLTSTVLPLHKGEHLIVATSVNVPEIRGSFGSGQPSPTRQGPRGSHAGRLA